MISHYPCPDLDPRLPGVRAVDRGRVRHHPLLPAIRHPQDHGNSPRDRQAGDLPKADEERRRRDHGELNAHPAGAGGPGMPHRHRRPIPGIQSSLLVYALKMN